MAAHSGAWRRRIDRCLSGRASRKRQQASAPNTGMALPLRFRIDTRFACDIGEPPDSLGLSLERAIPLPSSQFRARASGAGPRAELLRKTRRTFCTVLFNDDEAVLRLRRIPLLALFVDCSEPRRYLLAAQRFDANGLLCRDRQRGFPGPSPEMQPAHNHSAGVDRHQRVRP